MRTKFTAHGAGDITIEYDDVMSGLRQCRTFSLQGAYVYELLSVNTSQQVCEMLASRGNALMASAKNFDKVVRAEFKKMMADDKKIANA